MMKLKFSQVILAIFLPRNQSNSMFLNNAVKMKLVLLLKIYKVQNGKSSDIPICVIKKHQKLLVQF